MKLSIIIPALNESRHLLASLQSLSLLKNHPHEIIIVDGGSDDDTLKIAEPYVDFIFTSEKGRATQMNMGAAHASGDILWFLHADSLIPDNAYKHICTSLQNNQHIWGRFNIKLSGSNPVFRIIEQLINLRSKITKIATGDQGIFVLRSEFEKLNGFAAQPLMEDIQLCKQLKKISAPACLVNTITTSSRRWESRGIIKTVILMWYLRLAYFLGTPASKLAKQYQN